MFIEGINDDHREFQPFCLMDGHHLDIPFWERLIRIFILVNTSNVEQTEEAIKKMKTEIIPVPIGDDGVMIVILENV